MQKNKKPLPKRSKTPIKVENIVTDGTNFYLADDRNSQYPLTVMYQTGTDPSNWTFQDQNNRIYRPYINSDPGTVAEKQETQYNTTPFGLIAKNWDAMVDWSNSVPASSLLAPLARTIRDTREGRNPVVQTAKFFDSTGLTQLTPELVYNLGTNNIDNSDVINAGLLALPFTGKLAGKVKQFRKILPKGVRLKNPETLERFERMQQYKYNRDRYVPTSIEEPIIDDIIEEVEPYSGGSISIENNPIIVESAKPVLQGRNNTVDREVAKRAMRIAEAYGEKKGRAAVAEATTNQTDNPTRSLPKRGKLKQIFEWSKYDPNGGFLYGKPATRIMNAVKLTVPIVGAADVASNMYSYSVNPQHKWGWNPIFSIPGNVAKGVPIWYNKEITNKVDSMPDGKETNQKDSSQTTQVNVTNNKTDFNTEALNSIYEISGKPNGTDTLTNR